MLQGKIKLENPTISDLILILDAIRESACADQGLDDPDSIKCSIHACNNLEIRVVEHDDEQYVSITGTDQ